MEQNKLFTYDRLNDFVKNYTEYVEEKVKQENSTESENYKFYHFEQNPDGVTMYNLGRFGRNIFQSMISI